MIEVTESQLPAGFVVYKAVGDEASLYEYLQVTTEKHEKLCASAGGDSSGVANCTVGKMKDWTALYTQLRPGHALGTISYRWEKEYTLSNLVKVTFNKPLDVVICRGPGCVDGEMSGTAKATAVKAALGMSYTDVLMTSLGAQRKALLMEETTGEWELVFSHAHLNAVLRAQAEAEHRDQVLATFFRHPVHPFTATWCLYSRINDDSNAGIPDTAAAGVIMNGDEAPSLVSQLPLVKLRYETDDACIHLIGNPEAPHWLSIPGGTTASIPVPVPVPVPVGASDARADACMIELPSLFGKAEATGLQISPGGRWLGWLARVNGALNLFVAPLPLPSGGHETGFSSTNNNIPGARQLTCSTGRDICFAFRFSADDRRIIYIRETEHGAELYHPYVLDLDVTSDSINESANKEIAASSMSHIPVAMSAVESGRDLLADHPRLTCAVGFVGCLQLWLPHLLPDVVVLSTGTGTLLWDLSAINMTTGELTIVMQNPANSASGRVRLIVTLVVHVTLQVVSLLISFITAGLLKLPVDRLVPAPAAPLQYFVSDDAGGVIGCAECAISLSGIGMQFSRIYGGATDFTNSRDRSNHSFSKRPVCSVIPFAALNMQLVGSGGATGSLRFDLLEDGEVAVHTCDVSDTTAYVKYPSGEVLSGDSRADIDGFITHPITGAVEAVLITVGRQEIVPLGAAGEQLKKQLEQLTELTGRSIVHDGLLSLCSRTRDGAWWVLRGSSDTEAASYYLANMSTCTLKPLHELTHAAVPVPVPRLLLSARPALASLPLVRTESVFIPARDGEMIPCYLTRPRKSNNNNSIIAAAVANLNEDPGRVPLAIMLHGGPSARDYTGFDPGIQLLASRGFAVLSVNYRGSTGFGMRYLRLGDGVVGMHRDVEDARRWAVNIACVADPARVVIIGGSWGGYLALGGATGMGIEATELEKEHKYNKSNCLYAGCVGIVPLVCVGAANDSKSFRGDPLVARYWRQIYGPQISNSVEVAKQLSPLYQMDRFKRHTAKLLLIHGESDPRVPKEHSDAVAREAKRLGIEGAHLCYAQEGHSIRREANVLHMWHEIEKFVCQCVDLPAPPPVLRVEDCTATAVRWKSKY